VVKLQIRASPRAKVAQKHAVVLAEMNVLAVAPDGRAILALAKAVSCSHWMTRSRWWTGQIQDREATGVAQAVLAQEGAARAAMLAPVRALDRPVLAVRKVKNAAMTGVRAATNRLAARNPIPWKLHLVISAPIPSRGSGKTKARASVAAVVVGVAAIRAALAAPVAVRAAVAVIVVVATGAETARNLISTPFRRGDPKGSSLRVKIIGFIQLLNNLKIQ
jgi:hypothetical protein